MKDIVIEIYNIWHSGRSEECNIVIVPENRRIEIEEVIQENPFAQEVYTKERRVKFFGLDLIFSSEIDKIKVGYMI